MSTSLQTGTIWELLQAHDAGSVAISAPDRPSLSHGDLRRLVAGTVETLNGFGIGRGDRVAIVLPNGPEMATAFLAIAGAAATAPLNPAYRREDFDFSLADLQARALVVAAGQETPAREAAMAIGIEVIELMPGTQAGDFTLRQTNPSAAQQATRPGLAEADDVALLLHTSGTTARPKLVPLTQCNVTASARHIGAALQLGPSDVCLNIMPLFHIHGLIAAVLSSVAAGGSVHCTPGFNAFRFFSTFDKAQPSWMTAVPTMHQALLTLAERNHAIIARGRLRLIRSSSASMPPQVMQELERLFGVPVVESYGMTEAAHQMASNPLPPQPRFPGCVGLAAGPEIAIMDEDGVLLPSGELGEVVIRGPNVTSGYVANPAANEKAFTNGWFRTGDQGTIDQDGYLRLTGRLKEIINRGGEKISPLEVDEVMMDHPAVAQVVTFASPHKMFGEEVACAVVLRDGHEANEEALRNFAASRLAAFKVPSRVIVVAEIPKGATGKLQRIGLAAKLGLGS
jgi:acyl-CoA synthetase (AMP-forming)/AMP-acid ligase II